MRSLSATLLPGRAALAAAVGITLLAAGGAAFAQDTGTADFTRYMAVGDSLTAGFASSGLHEDVQRLSYPALLAGQAGIGDTFEQPLAGAPGIPPLLSLQGFNGASPIIAPRAANPGAPLNLTLPRPYDNMAVPGFRVGDVVRTVTGNAIIDLILRGQGTQLQQAAALQPTLATVWLGNNDVLAAATSGLVIEGVTLTPVGQFRSDYRTVLATLSAVGADLVVATIPNVTAIPFVNTLPPVLVDPSTGEPVLIGGAPVPLIGPAGPLSLGDKVLLSASALLGVGIGIPVAAGGTGQPLPDSAFLTVAEFETIVARTAAYNSVIREEAASFGAAVVPIDTFFDRVAAEGFALGGGQTYTTDFLTGGIFSYDGVHPTPFGYAVVANQFIRVINDTFGAAIPRVPLFPFAFGTPGSAGATIPDATAGAITSSTAALYSKVASDQLLRALRVDAAASQGPPRPRPPVDEPDAQAPELPGAGGPGGGPPAVPPRPELFGGGLHP